MIKQTSERQARPSCTQGTGCRWASHRWAVSERLGEKVVVAMYTLLCLHESNTDSISFVNLKKKLGNAAENQNEKLIVEQQQKTTCGIRPPAPGTSQQVTRTQTACATPRTRRLELGLEQVVCSKNLLKNARDQATLTALSKVTCNNPSHPP